MLINHAYQLTNHIFQVVVPEMPSVNSVSNHIAPSKAIPDNTLTVRGGTVAPAPFQPRSTTPAPAPAVVYTPRAPLDMDIHAPNPMLMGHSISSLAQASNISVETLAAAIRFKVRQNINLTYKINC